MLLLPPRKIIIDINLYLSDKLYRFAYKKTCRKAGFAKALLLHYFPTTFFANAAAALQSASLGRPLCMRPKDPLQ